MKKIHLFVIFPLNRKGVFTNRKKLINSFDKNRQNQCFLRAIDLDSSNAEAYYYLGLSSVIRGELEEAAELFTHTLDIKSEHVPTLRDSAYVYLTLGKLEQATERIKKARSLAPDDSQVKILDRKIKLAKIFEQTEGIISRIRHK
jgi:tetratricopeptide (TPR) repeat protein